MSITEPTKYAKITDCTDTLPPDATIVRHYDLSHPAQIPAQVQSIISILTKRGYSVDTSDLLDELDESLLSIGFYA